MLFLPVAAIRACDFLTGHALAHYHPIVVAHVLCSKDAFREHALQSLRDAQYPRGTTLEMEESGAAAVQRQFEQAVSIALLSYVESKGIPRVLASAPPPREDAASVGYCPRCHAQFATLTATCEACGDLASVPFPDNPDAPAAALNFPRSM